MDQLLHPYKFYGRDMSGILFFIFASCEPLKLNDSGTELFLIASPRNVNAMSNLGLEIDGSVIEDCNGRSSQVP